MLARRRFLGSFCEGQALKGGGGGDREEVTDAPKDADGWGRHDSNESNDQELNKDDGGGRRSEVGKLTLNEEEEDWGRRSNHSCEELVNNSQETAAVRDGGTDSSGSNENDAKGQEVTDDGSGVSDEEKATPDVSVEGLEDGHDDAHDHLDMERGIGEGSNEKADAIGVTVGIDEGWELVEFDE